MENFLTRVENYVGSISDTDAVTGWLTAASRTIIDLMPQEKLEKYAVEAPIGTSGTNLQHKKLLRAHKSNRPCRIVDAGLLASVIDSGSIHYAIALDPVGLYNQGLFFIYSAGAATSGTALVMEYPTVLYTQQSIINFPSELEQAVVLSASMNAALQLIGSKNTEINSLTYVPPTPPTSLSVPAFIWNNTSFTDASYNSAIYSDATASTASWTDAIINIIAPTTIDISGLTFPTYTKQVAGTSFTNMATYIADGSDLAKAEVETQHQRTKLEQFQMELYNELNEYNKEKTAFDAYVGQAIENAKLAQEKLIAQSQMQIELNKFNEAKTLEAALENNRQALEVAIQNKNMAAQVDLQNKAKTMETDSFNRSKALETDIVNKTNSLRKDIEEYTAKLQKFQSESAQYGAEVNSGIANYSKNVEKKMGEINNLVQLFALLKTEYSEQLKMHL